MHRRHRMTSRPALVPQVITDEQIVQPFFTSPPWEPKKAQADSVPGDPSPKRLSAASASARSNVGSVDAQAVDLFIKQRKGSHAIGEISNTWDVRQAPAPSAVIAITHSMLDVCSLPVFAQRAH